MGKRKTRLILGSSSPFRKKILKDAGFEFDCIAPHIDEKQIREKDFRKLVLKLALAKRDAILKAHALAPNSILVTSDVIGVHRGKLREKPVSRDEVIAWHREYPKGKTKIYCSLVAHHVGLNKTLKKVDTASLSWREIPERVIGEIAADPMTYKAAAFTDRSFLHYTKKLDGSIDTVMGIPVRILEDFLEKLGYYT